MQRVIIDVREPQEFASGHVEGAINIPPAELLKGASALDGIAKDAELVLYCVSGSRSNVAKNVLEGMGFSNIVNGINKEHVRVKYGS